MIVINSKVIENQVWKAKKWFKNTRFAWRIEAHSAPLEKTYHEDFEFVILDYFIESGLIFDNNLFGQHVARHQSDPKNDG